VNAIIGDFNCFAFQEYSQVLNFFGEG